MPPTQGHWAEPTAQAHLLWQPEVGPDGGQGPAGQGHPAAQVHMALVIWAAGFRARGLGLWGWQRSSAGPHGDQRLGNRGCSAGAAGALARCSERKFSGQSTASRPSNRPSRLRRRRHDTSTFPQPASHRQRGPLDPQTVSVASCAGCLDVLYMYWLAGWLTCGVGGTGEVVEAGRQGLGVELYPAGRVPPPPAIGAWHYPRLHQSSPAVRPFFSVSQHAAHRRQPRNFKRGWRRGPAGPWSGHPTQPPDECARRARAASTPHTPGWC